MLRFLCVVAFLGGLCKAQEPGQHVDFDLAVGGTSRSYTLFVPQTFNSSNPYPLIFNFHGYGGSPTSSQNYGDFSGRAGQYGWIVAYGLGTRSFTGQNGWNGGGCCGNIRIDDVAYVRAVLNHLTVVLGINVRVDAIFATGFSNGGFFSHRLACDASEIFAGVAPHAGFMAYGGDFSQCNPSDTTHVIHFHGTADNVIPYNGTANYPSFRENEEFWQERNGCTGPTEVVFLSDTTECERASFCNGGSTVEYCTIFGLDHSWPDPSTANQPQTNIDATDYLFVRFSQIAGLQKSW